MEIVAIAAAPTLAVLATYFLSRRKLNEVHVLVNQRMTDAVERIAALEAALSLQPGEEIPQ